MFSQGFWIGILGFVVGFILYVIISSALIFVIDVEVFGCSLLCLAGLFFLAGVVYIRKTKPIETFKQLFWISFCFSGAISVLAFHFFLNYVFDKFPALAPDTGILAPDTGIIEHIFGRLVLTALVWGLISGIVSKACNIRPKR